MELTKETLRLIPYLMEQRGYKVFKNNIKPFNFNFVGIRTKTKEAGKFDDWFVAFVNKGTKKIPQYEFRKWPITTDPGVYWLKNPMRVVTLEDGKKVRGCAVLKEGQYRSAWKYGWHKRYRALQQAKPVTVYRDYNKNVIIDTEGMPTQTGLFGINIHHAGWWSKIVGKWSAGCQVFQRLKDWKEFWQLVLVSRANWGNYFTYTLILEEWLEEM